MKHLYTPALGIFIFFILFCNQAICFSGIHSNFSSLNNWSSEETTFFANVDLALISKLDPECFGGFGGSIEVTASGGVSPYQFSLNGGLFQDSPIFEDLASGDYTITVKDSEDDTNVLMVTLDSPSALIGDLVSKTDNLCFEGSSGMIEVTASGGTSEDSSYTYLINGGPPQSIGQFINLANGFYVITILDDNECMTQITSTISSPTKLELIEVSKTDITCAGMSDGKCTVEAFGGSEGYMYSIDAGMFDSIPEFNNLVGGTHIIRVKDVQGCEQDLIIFIDEPDLLTFDLIASELICYDGEDGIIEVLNLVGLAPFQFVINDEEPISDSIFTGLIAGEYDITVIDSLGCEQVEDIEVIAPDSLHLTLDTIVNVLCGGDSTGMIQLSQQNGIGSVTFSLGQTFNFSGTFSNLAAGAYAGGVIDSIGCTAEVAFEIAEIGDFSIEIENVQNVQCYGQMNGRVAVNVLNGLSPFLYSIDGVDYQDTSYFDALSSGDYMIEVLDSLGCSNFIDVTIAEPDSLEISILNINNVSCFGDSTGAIELVLNGGTAPYFFGDSMNIEFDDTIWVDELEAGDIVLHFSDTNGCMISDTVSIYESDSLVLFVSEFTADNCGPDFTGSVDLNAVGGYAPLTISIDSLSEEEGIFDSLMYGIYNATVVDDLGCSTFLEFEIPFEEGLILDSLVSGDVSCNGAEDGFISIYISNNEGELFFTDDDIVYGGNEIEDLSGGIYVVRATDDSTGCFLDVVVTISEPNVLELSIFDIFISPFQNESYIEVIAAGGTQPFLYSIDDKQTFQDTTLFSNLEMDEYVIHVKDANGCTDSIQQRLVGISDLNSLNFNVYPNPTADIVHLEFESEINEGVELELRSVDGGMIRKFSQSEFILSGTGIELDLHEVLNGLYILAVKHKEKKGYLKLVIQK